MRVNPPSGQFYCPWNETSMPPQPSVKREQSIGLWKTAVPSPTVLSHERKENYWSVSEVQTPYTVGLLGGYSSEYHRRVSNHGLLPTPSVRVLKGRQLLTYYYCNYYIHLLSPRWQLYLLTCYLNPYYYYFPLVLTTPLFFHTNRYFFPFKIHTSCQSRPYFMSSYTIPQIYRNFLPRPTFALLNRICHAQ